MNQPTSPPWSLCDAEELYAIDQWSSGYFGLSDEGEVTVRLQGDAPKPKSVSIPKIIKEIRDRGKDLPILLRFGELLESRIRLLNESFRKAIIDEDYEGTYQGVFPLKVKQQQQAPRAAATPCKPVHWLRSSKLCNNCYKWTASKTR